MLRLWVVLQYEMVGIRAKFMVRAMESGLGLCPVVNSAVVEYLDIFCKTRKVDNTKIQIWQHT